MHQNILRSKKLVEKTRTRKYQLLWGYNEWRMFCEIFSHFANETRFVKNDIIPFVLKFGLKAPRYKQKMTPKINRDLYW
jgi:hypothetical protein